MVCLNYWWGICWCGVVCIMNCCFVILVVGINCCGIFVIYCLLELDLEFILIVIEDYGDWGLVIGVFYWCFFILEVYEGMFLGLFF